MGTKAYYTAHKIEKLPSGSFRNKLLTLTYSTDKVSLIFWTKNILLTFGVGNVKGRLIGEEGKESSRNSNQIITH